VTAPDEEDHEHPGPEGGEPQAQDGSVVECPTCKGTGQVKYRVPKREDFATIVRGPLPPGHYDSKFIRAWLELKRPRVFMHFRLRQTPEENPSTMDVDVMVAMEPFQTKELLDDLALGGAILYVKDNMGLKPARRMAEQ